MYYVVGTLSIHENISAQSGLKLMFNCKIYIPLSEQTYATEHSIITLH